MQYSLDNSTWSDSIPTGTSAGTYTVYYRVVDSSGAVVVEPASVTATISKAAPTYTAPTANTLTYDGSAQALVTAGSTSDGTMEYSTDGSTWSTAIPTGTNAGSYTVYYRVTGDANHEDVASASVAVTIDQLEAVLSWSNTSFTYDGNQHAPTATVTNLCGSDTCAVTVSGAQKDADTYTATATALSNTNYKLPATATQDFTIDPLVVGLTWANTALTYNGSAQAPTATATGLLSGDTCAVTVSGEQTDAGFNYTATAASLSNSNYALPVNVTQRFDIARAALTVKAKDNAITYGDAPSGNGIEVAAGQLFGSDTLTSLGTPAYAFNYNRYDDVSANPTTYTITPSGLSSDNYLITYQDGALTVNPREVTLVWSTPNSFDYTGSAITWPAPTVGNLVNNDAVTAVWATPTSTNDVYTATNVGAYAPVVGSLSGTKAANYTLPSSKTGSWSIAQAANSMTVSIAGWTYGKASNAPVVTADFGAGTETFAYYTDDACTQQVTGSDLDSAGRPKNAGDYWVKATIAATDSYAAAEATCPFTVAKAKVTVTAKDLQTVRGNAAYVIADANGVPQQFKLKSTDADSVYAYDVTGDLAAGDDASTFVNYVMLSCSVPVDSSGNTTTAGGYAITAAAAQTHPNYDITFADGTYTVTRALANVSAVGYTGTYDGVADNEKITVTVTDTASGTQFGGSGTGAITVYYAEDDFQTSLGLTSAQIAALKGDDITKDSFKSAWAALQTALAGKATDSPKYKDAGTHTVYFMVVSDQATPDVIFGSRDVVINKAQLTATAGNKTVKYGEDATAAPEPGVTLAGFVNGETESALRALSPAKLTGTAAYTYVNYAAGSPVGRYAITPSGLTAANYDITYVDGALTVEKAALKVKAKPNTITYGDAPADDGVEYEGLVAGDTADSLSGTLAFAFTYAQYGDVGTYAGDIVPSGLTSSNYDITYEAGDLTVVPLELVLTWPTPDSFDYTGSELTYGPPALSGAVNGDDVSIGTYTGGAATDAGAHTAEVVDLVGGKAGNYKLPANAAHDWTVVGAANGAAVEMGDWIYGDEPAEPQVTATFGADTATFAYFADEGCTQPVAADALDANGVPRFAGTYWVRATIPAAANYNGAEATAKFTVKKRPATVTAADQVVKVGGAIDASLAKATASGLAAGDEFTAVTLAGMSTEKATDSGTITPSAAAVKDAAGADMSANYEITYVPGKLIVVGDSATENGKTIYVLASDVWMTVDEAAALLAAADVDDQLIALCGAAAFDNATGEALPVAVADRSKLKAEAGDYPVTFKTNPEVTATVHVTGAAKPAADGTDTGSTEKPATTRAASKAASPATGDAPLALTAGLLLASAIVAAAALMLARRQTRRRGRHAR